MLKRKESFYTPNILRCVAIRVAGIEYQMHWVTSYLLLCKPNAAATKTDSIATNIDSIATNTDSIATEVLWRWYQATQATLLNSITKLVTSIVF